MTPNSEYVREILVQALILNAVDDGAWPCYVSSLPDKPDQAACVFNTTGTKEGRLSRGGKVIERPGIMIHVRSKDERTGWIKMQEIQNQLDATIKAVVTVGADTVKIHCFTRTAPFMSMGQEIGTTTRRFYFSLNVTLSLTE